MEVLISMFVMMIGLLGVAALIPLAHYEISEGTRAEYASALGRAAYRNFKIRHALEPSTWYDAGGWQMVRPVVLPDLPQNPNANAPLNYTLREPISFDRAVMFPVVIDPLGLGGAGPGRNLPPLFPASLNNNNTLRDGRALPRITVLPGLNVGNVRGQAIPLSRQVGEQMFRGQDDLLFNLPDDGDKPPTQLFSQSNSNSRRVALGEYSWLVTLVPHAANPPPGYPGSELVQAPRGNTGIMVTMSIVVFHRRVLGDPNRELAVRIDSFPGGGVGGGDVALDLSGSSANAELRIGQWIMVAGGGQFYRWYRVIAAEDPLPGVKRQQVTLVGPDMPPGLMVATLNPPASAWIIDGVVAVYEKHFRLEGPSIWAN